MGVLVRCPLPSCNKLTGWVYPSFEWARTHVPGVPPRVFLYDDARSRQGMTRDRCPDPFGHVNAFRRQRDPSAPLLGPEVRYARPPEDPVDDPNEGLEEPEPEWESPNMPPGAWWD